MSEVNATTAKAWDPVWDGLQSEKLDSQQQKILKIAGLRVARYEAMRAQFEQEISLRENNPVYSAQEYIKYTQQHDDQLLPNPLKHEVFTKYEDETTKDKTSHASESKSCVIC